MSFMMCRIIRQELKLSVDFIKGNQGIVVRGQSTGRQDNHNHIQNASQIKRGRSKQGETRLKIKKKKTMRLLNKTKTKPKK